MESERGKRDSLPLQKSRVANESTQHAATTHEIQHTQDWSRDGFGCGIYIPPFLHILPPHSLHSYSSTNKYACLNKRVDEASRPAKKQQPMQKEVAF